MEKFISQMHCHDDNSNIRFLDSCHSVQALIDRAVEMHCPALAVTDHESLSGAIDAIRHVQDGKNNGSIPQDFQLAIGNEIYLVDDMQVQDDSDVPKATSPYYHFILIAKDQEGFEQLKELSTLAWQSSYRTGKMERVPTTKANLKRIVGANKGHLLASTACLGGELGSTVIAMRDNSVITSLQDKLNEFITMCLDLFGDDFRLEMQPGLTDEQIYVNTFINEHFPDIKHIVTCDVHYLSKDLRSVHEAYLNSREDGQREVGDFYECTYMMDVAEIHERMDSYLGEDTVDELIRNTNEWAKDVQDYNPYHDQVVPKPTLPEFQLDGSFAFAYEHCPYIEKFANSDNIYDQYFLYLVIKGWWEKEYSIELPKEEIRKMMLRINQECEAIWETSERIHDKVSAYYLTALEIINMMWDDSEDGGDSLVGPSRGSVAAFYTCYLIGLQQINAYKLDIPYWRHLHASRPEMPDVDIDTAAFKRNRIIKATKKKYGYDRVLNICTFKTEGSKSAMLTSARGLGIDNDTASYVTGMIPVVRGATTSLSVMVHGDPENDIKPDTEFINACNEYPGWLETAMTIEGIKCGRSVHASGVIIFDDKYTKYNCMMKAPNGQPVTQWDADNSAYCGGLKFDYLTITNLDAMQICLQFLVDYGYIEWQGSLRATYDKYFSPSVINYEDVHMWEQAEQLKITNLFQFATAVGGQAIKKIKPRSLLQLGVANSVMRLMAQGDAEQPIDTYVRYKNNIDEWYECMHKYNLTEDEIHTVEKYLKEVSGMATMQEDIMRLSMDEHISDFDMIAANKLRKSVAKKKKKLQEQAKEMFFAHGKEVGTSDNLLNYVWNECITPQLGLNTMKAQVKFGKRM